MAHEKIDDWWEYARELAKAERDMAIEKWVHISIEYRTKERERVILYRYNLPRNVYERYQWAIRWHHARLICRYPRENVQVYYSFYDKRTGLETGYDSAPLKAIGSKGTDNGFPTKGAGIHRISAQ